MHKKMMMVALVLAACNSAFAVTCMVNEESVADSGQFDKNVVSTVIDLSEQGKILLNRGELHVSAARTESGYSIGVFNYKAGMEKGELLSSTINKSLPVMLIDGKAKLSVYCY